MTSAFEADVNLESISGPELSRKSIETSHLGTAAPTGDKFGNATFLPGKIVDGGVVEIEAQWGANARPPIHAAPETIRITFPLRAGEATAEKWEFTGFLTNAKVAFRMEEVVKGTLQIKVSGEIDPTDGA